MPDDLAPFVGTILALGTAIAAVAMAAFGGFAKRFGLWIAIVGLVAVEATRLISMGALVLAIISLWLLDRGVPGNRRRSPGVWIIAVITAGLAVVVMAQLA